MKPKPEPEARRLLASSMIDARRAGIKDGLVMLLHRLVTERMEQTEKRLTKRRRCLEMKR
jgi:hypothetical protein